MRIFFAFIVIISLCDCLKAQQNPYTNFGHNSEVNYTLAEVEVVDEPDESYYRFGFNGKENDREWGTGGLTQDYGFRLYNPALGKFLTVDPLAPEYPWYTPFQFAGNKPIEAVDLDGLEELKVTKDFATGFDLELKVIKADKILNEKLVAISDPKLAKKITVYLAVGLHVQMGHTKSITKAHTDYYRYYASHPKTASEAMKNWAKKFEKDYNRYGVSFEDIKNEIVKENKDHIIILGVNPLDARSNLEHSLNIILHEIDFHLREHIRDGKGDGDGGVGDHKEAFDYDNLTDAQKKIIDTGNSIPSLEAPKNSVVRKLYNHILSAIKSSKYNTTKDSEKQKQWVIDFTKRNQNKK